MIGAGASEANGSVGLVPARGCGEENVSRRSEGIVTGQENAAVIHSVAIGTVVTGGTNKGKFPTTPVFVVGEADPEVLLWFRWTLTCCISLLAMQQERTIASPIIGLAGLYNGFPFELDTT